MATKWEINVALRTSGLPSPSRLIVLVLSDLADAQTGEVPEDRTPSLRELGEWTGLGKGPIADHLKLLEKHGWVIRTVPPIDLARREHARTKYRLAVGEALDPAGRPKRGRHAGHVPAEDEACPEWGHDAGHVPSGDMARPGGGHGGGHVPTEDKGMSRSGTVPYTDEVETIKNPSTSAKEPKQPKKEPKANFNRPDVDRICNHLADRVEALGIKRPRIGETWRTEGRLLLDTDGRTVDQVIRCIDWATSHHFWHRQIHSMPTLREKYDRLRLDAEAERRQANGRASPPREQLTEVNGLMLGERNLEAIERQKRMQRLQAAKDAGQPLSIEGHAA